MRSLLVVMSFVLLTQSNMPRAYAEDEIKRVDSCIDAYGAHIKGKRWSMYGGTTAGGVLICMTPGILIYPFFSSTVTSTGEKKIATLADGRQLLVEAQLRNGKKLDNFVAEVIKGSQRDVSREDIVSRLIKLEEDFSYCKKSYTESNGKKIDYAEPWSYEEIRSEMIKFYK